MSELPRHTPSPQVSEEESEYQPSDREDDKPAPQQRHSKLDLPVVGAPQGRPDEDRSRERAMLQSLYRLAKDNKEELANFKVSCCTEIS